MPPDVPSLPYEFVALGTPASHQSNNRAAVARWRQKVTTAAAAEWTAFPVSDGTLLLVVVYYHTGPAARIDVDNMLKPVQDALIGIAYDDDERVTDILVRKTRLDGPVSAREMSPTLRAAFEAVEPFVHVIIDRAPDHRHPLRERP